MFVKTNFNDNLNDVAVAFVARHPLLSFAGKDCVDAERAVVREGVSFAVAVVGEGETADGLLAVLMTDSVFPCGRDGLAKVSYFVADNPQAESDYRNGAGKYDEFLADGSDRAEDYLPFPPVPWNVTFGSGDAQTLCDFLDCAERGVSAVIFCDDDEEKNDAAAARFVAYRKERGGEMPTVFAYKRGEAERGAVSFFGDDSEETANAVRLLAAERHKTYLAEWMSGCTEAELDAAAEKDIAAMSSVIAGSNVLAALNLRTKALLAGFDIAPEDDVRPDEGVAFMEIYRQGDAIVYGDDKINGKPVIVYRNADFERNSLRVAFARQEHARWNAYMISRGFLPSSLADIASDTKGRDMAGRRHGNITTFDGLKTFRRIVAEHFGKSEESTDVIRYDFQIMDDAEWFVRRAGCKIVRRQ